MPENREERRYEVEWPVRVIHEGGEYTYSKTLNVSPTGLSFITSHRYYDGELLVAELTLGAACVVQCVARVVRELPRSSRFYCYAALFEQFTGNGGELLAETLQLIQRREHLPEEPALAPVAPAPKPIPEARPRDLGIPRMAQRGPVMMRRR